MITLPALTPTDPLPIAIGCRAGQFTLLCRRPSYGERLEDEGLAIHVYGGQEPGRWYARQTQRRIEACVIDWNGVFDGQGSHVPYESSTLVALLTANPDAAGQVALALARLYSETPTALGECGAPPAASGAADAATTCPTV